MGLVSHVSSNQINPENRNVIPGVIVSADASATSDNPADLDTGLSATGDTTFGFVVKFETGFLWTDIGRKAIAVTS